MIAGALAPAKINLGLEILGRRSDGYHEVRTVLAAISIYDRIVFRPGRRFSLRSDVDLGPLESNLVTIAANALRERAPAIAPEVQLRKQIPAGSGLGGASSDAVAALRAIPRLYELQLADGDIRAIATAIGSDVPFFLEGGVALAAGRGERLLHLDRPIDSHVVVVVPDVQIHAKTASLYASITPGDYSDGATIEASFRLIATGTLPDSTALRNAFERPLYERVPSLRDIPVVMKSLGAKTVGLCGAGPAHFAIESDIERANALAAACKLRMGRAVTTFACRMLDHGGLTETASRDVEILRWFETHDSAR